MSFGDALRLLSVLSANQIPEIDIMGGEPFLLQWMPEFIRAAQNQSIAINISTNGSLPGALRLLEGIGPEGLMVGISLEGSDEEKHLALTGSGHFRQAIESICILRDLGLDPLVKTVVNRSTVDDIRDIADLLKHLGVRRYFLLHMDLMTADESQRRDAMGFPEFLSVYEEMRSSNQYIEIHKVHASCFSTESLPSGARCAGGVRKLCIMPDGSAYPCNLFQSIPGMRLGNILTDDFASIWMSPKLSYFRSYSGNRCSIEECGNRDSCTGGCPAHGIYHSGDPEGTDIRCRKG